MKKADIERRSPNPNGYFGEWVPAINVKWHLWLPDVIKKFKGTQARGRHGIYTVHEFGDDELFWAWLEGLGDDAHEYPNGEFVRAQEMVVEDGWQRAQELADEVWPNHAVKVWSSGRSGGWLIVKGLGDIDDWDAVAVARWARFVKYIKCELDDLDYQFVWHLHVNVYENAPDYNPDAGFQLTLEDA